MAVSLTYASTVSAIETIAQNADLLDASDNGVKPVLNTSKALNGATTPPVTKVAYGTQLLTAGAATLDLTALTGTNSGAISGTGLKVQVAKFQALATNANSITIVAGASNPYKLLGEANSLRIGSYKSL